MARVSYTLESLANAKPGELSEHLERGSIVYFPRCPFNLPSVEDLEFLRREMPGRLARKNVSYHHESGILSGARGSSTIAARVAEILRGHNARVKDFLGRVIPRLAPNWEPATSSFRPLEEKGRGLASHASNELLHIDAGAYGATHGDRILRFFVNINPEQDRVWASKGTFAELFPKHAAEARTSLSPSLPEKIYSAAVHALARAIPTSRLLDTSPYDRAMRRFHNFMKDSILFQQSRDGYVEFSFPPYSAWMVFTDMTSHACLEGRFALVDTFIVPLTNCRFRELAPMGILESVGSPPRP